MAVSAASDLASRIESSTGSAQVQLTGSPGAEAARAAMQAAADSLLSIPHPEEPDDPLPSFVSDVTVEADGPAFWFDIADAEAYDGLIDTVVATLVNALDGAGATGTLQWWDR